MPKRLPAWLLPLVAIGVGAALMFAEDAPASRWAVQLVSAALGLAGYALSRHIRWSPERRLVAVGLTLALVMATLASSGIDGVHRWLGAGPIRLHASMLFAPTLVVFATEPFNETGLVALLALQLTHLLQPDAGQATAVAAAVATLLVARREPAAHARVAAAVLVMTGAITWARADPLGPAPFVEDILERALARGPGWATLAVIALALFVSSPLTGRAPAEETRAAGWALAAYFATSVLVSVVGSFPTPLLGYGPSPVIGAWLGLATLSSITTTAAAARPRRTF